MSGFSILRCAAVVAAIAAAQLAAAPARAMTPVPSERLPVSPDRMVVDDFNNDGNLDVATAAACEVRVLLGRGDGRFNPSVVVGSASSCPSLRTAVDSGDLNNDGNEDLVWAFDGSPVRVLLGHGDGTFAAPVTYAAGPNPDAIAVGDLNGDNHDDVVAADQGDADGRVYVLVANPDGTLQAAVAYARVDASQPDGITIDDFDGDGNPDVAAASEYIGTPCAGCSDGITVLPGNGDGTLGARSQTPIGTAFSLVPLDGGSGSAADLLTATTSDYRFLLANGDGTFDTGDTLDPGGIPVSADAGDFDHNGLLDVVGANLGTDVPAFISTSTGWSVLDFPLPVMQPPLPFPPPEASRRVVTGDFNNDGWTDVLVASLKGTSGGPGTIGTILNTPSGSPNTGSVDFGGSPVGTSAPTRSVAIRNTGVRPLSVRQVAIGGGGPAGFSVSSDGCAGQAVPEDGSCAITLSFLPAAVGTAHASLSVVADDPLGPYVVALQGSGTGTRPPT